MDHIVRPRGLGSLLSINVYIYSRGGMTVDVVISLAFIELYARLSAVFRSWTCAQHLKTLNSRTIEHLTGRLSTLCLVTTRQVHRSHSKPRRANTTREGSVTAPSERELGVAAQVSLATRISSTLRNPISSSESKESAWAATVQQQRREVTDRQMPKASGSKKSRSNKQMIK